MLIFLLGSLPAHAEDAPAPVPSEWKQRRLEICSASAAGDRKSLEALAAKDDLDYWAVLDTLLRAGPPFDDYARQFAGLLPGPAYEGLAPYAKRYTKSLDTPALEKAVTGAPALQKEGKLDEALAGLGEPIEKPRTIVAIYGEYRRGELLKERREVAAAAAAFGRSAEGALEIGWLVHASAMLYEQGLAHYILSEYRSALKLFERRLAVEERLGSKIGIGRAHLGLAHCLSRLGELEAAAPHYERSRGLAEETGDKEYLAKHLQHEGVELSRAMRDEEALASFSAAVEALGAARKSPMTGRFASELPRICTALATALTNCSSAASLLHRPDEAKRYAKEALQAARMSGSRRIIDDAGASLARLEGARDNVAGRALRALSHFQRAATLWRRVGARDDLADVLVRLARLRAQLGDMPRALSNVEEAVGILRETGAKRDLCIALRARSDILSRLGRFDEAEGAAREALNLAVGLEDEQLEIESLTSVASTFFYRTQYSRAQAYLHRAMDVHKRDPAHTTLAIAFALMAEVHRAMHDPERALEYIEKVQAEIDAGRHLGAAAKNTFQHVEVLLSLDRGAEAEKLLLDLLESRKRHGTPKFLASLWGLLGDARFWQKRFAEAHADYERAAGYHVASGDRHWEIYARTRMARALLWADEPDRAREEARFACDLARESGNVSMHAHAIAALAEIEFKSGNYGLTMDLAKGGAEIAGDFAMDRSAGEQAVLRSQFGELPRLGLSAAYAVKQPAFIFEFMERGRATALVASLGGRDALRAAQVPRELADKEAAAKAGAAMAYEFYDRARATKAPLEERRRLRIEMEEARARHGAAVDAIERAVRQQADLAYPTPAPLASAQAALRADEVLLMYGHTVWRWIALVVTRDAARLVRLGKIDEADAALDALAEDPTDAARIAAVSKLMFDPLKLGAETKRLIVAPDGRLSYVPFAAVDREREICLVPSATAWMVLRETRAEPGERILAVGDPSYSGRPTPSHEVKRLMRGAGFVRLPKSRAEAEAIGDDVLLGVEASETRFREVVASRKRWRAVHLACHGLVDDVIPTNSALVLTHDAENDGYLQANEVFAQVPVSADLVVLSACETGRGRIFKGVGLLGLSRAFMMAGTERVITSLWKVDDAATQALMTKFYALWNPDEGKGITAAAALKAAQAHVRAQEAWKEPRFWAAWVLWGLPE